MADPGAASPGAGRGSGTGRPPAGPAGRRRGPEAPPEVLRAWDQAEARLFPVVLTRPDLYQQALALIGELAASLREDCPDLPSLLAAHARGAGLVAGRDGALAGQIKPEVLAGAACAARYRELLASAAVAGRLAAVRDAREQGLAWAVVEENGEEARAPYAPYQRVEAHAATGRALVVSIEPDETLSRAVRRLDSAQLDLETGNLAIGGSLGAYDDAGAFESALERARAELA